MLFGRLLPSIETSIFPRGARQNDGETVAFRERPVRWPSLSSYDAAPYLRLAFTLSTCALSTCASSVFPHLRLFFLFVRPSLASRTPSRAPTSSPHPPAATSHLLLVRLDQSAGAARDGTRGLVTSRWPNSEPIN